MRYLPPSGCLTKVVIPRSVLVYMEGLRGRETGFLPQQQRQTGAEPLNLKRHSWFCCAHAALQDPSSDPCQDRIQASPSNSPLSVCFYEHTNGQTNRLLRLLPRKARWIYKL